MITDIPIIAVVLAVTFVARAGLRFYHREPAFSDAMSHLAMVDAIRANGHRIPGILPRFVPEQRLLYPAFFHWLLSYLPPKWLERFEPISGAIVDTVHNALLMTAAYVLFTSQGLSASQVQLGVGLAGLLFAISPRLVGGRAFFLSVRPFGELLVSVAFLGTLWFIWWGNSVGLIVAICAVAIISITSKLATQAVVFLSPLMSLLLWTPWFVVSFALGLVLAALASRGYAVEVWRSQAAYLRLWRAHIGLRWPMTRDSALDILKSIMQARRTGLWKSEAVRLAFNPEVNWLLQLLWLILILLLVAISWVGLLRTPAMVMYLGLWVLGLTAIGLIIWLPPLRFLGEHDRYLEYAVLPGSIFIAYFAVSTRSLPWLLPAVSILLVTSLVVISGYYGLYISLYRRNRWRYGEFEKVLAWLNAQPPQVILSNPMHGQPAAVWRHTPHTLVTWLGNINDQTSDNWLEDYLALCPEEHFQLPRNLCTVTQRFGVDLVLVNRAVEGRHDLDGFELLFRNEGYSVFRSHRESEEDSRRIS